MESMEEVVEPNNQSLDEPTTEINAEVIDRRRNQQNMIDQLKEADKRMLEGRAQPADEHKVAMLHKYRSLSRFDAEKDKLLSMWAKDKSCERWKTYDNTMGTKYTETAEGVSGFGSRPDPTF